MVHQVVELVERAQRKTQALSPTGAQRRKPDCPPGLPGRLPREVTLRLRLRGELPHCPQRGQRWMWQAEEREGAAGQVGASAKMGPGGGGELSQEPREANRT